METFGVSGAAGFIGSNFTHFAIGKGHKVIAIDSLSYPGFLFNLEPWILKSRILGLKNGKDFSRVNFSIEKRHDRIYKKVFSNKVLCQIPDNKLKGYNITLFENKEDFTREIESFIESNEKLLFIIASITDEELINIILPHVNCFFNFAAETHVDRSILSQEEFIFTDILGTYNILKVLIKYKNVKKFIQISTDEVYGSSIEGSFNESSILNPSSPYAATKASADLLCLAFYKTFNAPAILIRPSNNYGPRQYPEKLIPLSIIKILKGEKVPIYGSGKQKREWIYVDDCVKGIYQVFLRGTAGEIYNIGSGFEIENLEVVQKIGNILGKNEDIYEFVKDRPSHDTRYFLNSSKIKSLGWEPETDFEEGLKLTVDWYIENKDLYIKIMESADFSSFYKLWYQKR